MRILIATATAPKNKDSAVTMFATIRECAKEGGLKIPPGIMWTGGRGCTNLAMDVMGPDDEVERFANAITMALMPSKWCTTTDALPEEDTCEVSPIN